MVATNTTAKQKKTKFIKLSDVMKVEKANSATGRRKESAARVWIAPGSGKIIVNGRENYFADSRHDMTLHQPFAATKTNGQFDIWCRVSGGGTTGQAEAIRHGLSRALGAIDENYRKVLRDGPFMTRDPRAVERKKPGQKKARKSFQFSKR